MKTALTALALSLALGSLAPAAPTAAQDAARAPVDELPAVEAPPELPSRYATKFDRALKRLRNSNADKRAKTEAELIEYGRAAIPGLISKLHTDHEGLGEGLLACLEAVVDLRDRELVAAHADSEHLYGRAFAARAGGALGVLETLDPLEPLLDDASPLVRVEAALALARNGREEGLDVLALNFETAEARVLEALAGISGAGDHGPLVDLLALDARRQREEPDVAAAERRAAVRMLHAIGDLPAVRALGTALDDPHNLVQRQAIDAVRDVCEGAEPFSGRSIFEQVGEVERLKDVAAKWTPPEGDDEG